MAIIDELQGMARNTLIETAEKNDIPWRARAKDLKAEDDMLSKLYESIEDTTILYPDYYNQGKLFCDGPTYIYAMWSICEHDSCRATQSFMRMTKVT